MRDAKQPSHPRGPSPALAVGVGSSVNPFAVSRVGLAQLEFVASTSGGIDLVLAQMRRSNWRGQIIGPHGSGKTTLTIALAKSLAGEFQRFTWLVLHPGRWWLARPRCRVQLVARSVPSGKGLEFLEFRSEDPDAFITKRLQQLGASELCFIDGVDQLSLGWQRKLIHAAGGHSVVWTSHQRLPVELPLLAELRPDLKVFRTLVAQLLQGTGETMPQERVDESFALADGDFRRGFGRLYDAWEQAKRN